VHKHEQGTGLCFLLASVAVLDNLHQDLVEIDYFVGENFLEVASGFYLITIIKV
jgi:hypothetical protein